MFTSKRAQVEPQLHQGPKGSHTSPIPLLSRSSVEKNVLVESVFWGSYQNPGCWTFVYWLGSWPTLYPMDLSPWDLPGSWLGFPWLALCPLDLSPQNLPRSWLDCWLCSWLTLCPLDLSPRNLPGFLSGYSLCSWLAVCPLGSCFWLPGSWLALCVPRIYLHGASPAPGWAVGWAPS